MPVSNGDYVQRDVDDIQSDIETALRDEFGDDIDLTNKSVFRTFSSALAQTLVENTERSLDEVYDAAYLDRAFGDDLDNVVAIVGIKRREATFATGLQRFESDGAPSQNRVVDADTTIQTDESNPVSYETDETISLRRLSTWESDLSEYDGDTAGASTTTTYAYEGSQSVELPATSGDVIYRSNRVVEQGSETRWRVRPQASTEPWLVFGHQDQDNYYRVALDVAASELRIEVVDGGNQVDSATQTGVTVPTGEWAYVDLDWGADGDITATLYDSNDNEHGSVTFSEAMNSQTYTGGAYGVGSGDANNPKHFDLIAETAVSVNVTAVDSGPVGNVSVNSVISMPSPPSGIDGTTNRYPIGDDVYFDLDEESFVVGQDEESDSELRERTKRTLTGGGTATFDAILGSILNDIDDVVSVTLYENKTDSNKTVDGATLPPYSFEAVVFGGNKQDIAEAIFETKAVTSRDVGLSGHGTPVSVTVTSDVNDQDYTVDFTRPTEVAVDLSIDLRVTDEYVGDDAIRDDIVSYVGGIDSDGNEVIGTDVAEDVYIDEIEDRIVGRENGVQGIEVDGNGKSQISVASPNDAAVATNSNNLQVIDTDVNDGTVGTGNTEVVTVNANDGSIVLNTAQV